ncbi:caspase, EACC1-associated type [Merismopedia glauca]|uniref:Uncharacterized protein n=1 Tax=Merismopedia glauca CCAP 1448/3 TaxID=1296344 RepID=A0A2T1C556_9CYAN|nr:SUMF1/EgtB/PvdO family nonheme iron enzyme [Merismopedia glauca]PSB03386.1 hypothetical protein C7B64_08590 [Merismopedia glauca CCAP 1448/3]
MAKVALLVGVSEYQSGFNPLPNAIEDINAMEKVLREKGDFEVTTLANPDPHVMQLAIDRLFANRTSEDLLLFYFSGHGIKDHRRKFYLTTSQTTKDKQRIIVPATAISTSYLQEQMTESRSERQVIILDCCYSGAIAQGLTLKGDAEIDILAELGGKGRAILTSSNSIQESYIQDGLELSIYTHYLVEGIETGAADLDKDGRISADELHKYTSKRVQEASPAMTPQFYPVEEGYEIYLARSPINDPKLIYRQEVERIVEEDENEIDFITGEIDYLNRVYLDRFWCNLGLSAELAKQIETEVMQPFRQRQQNLQEYQKVYSEAIKKRFPFTTSDRAKLKRFQEILGLRDQDIQALNVYPSWQVFEFDVVTVDAQGQEIQTTDVGSFPPNLFGLYDMHGNVWEWCADTWHKNYEGAPSDGSAWIDNGNDNQSRTLRGGSWYGNPVLCRSAIRFIFTRGDFYFNVGFRVVLSSGRTV